MYDYCGATAFMCTYAVSHYRYLRYKSDNETHKGRVEADICKRNAEVAQEERLQKLLQNPEYRAHHDAEQRQAQERDKQEFLLKYFEQRADYAEDVLFRIRNTDNERKFLENVFGKCPSLPELLNATNEELERKLSPQ